VTGSPILSGVLAFLDARIVAEYPGGDHTIILGQVEALGQGGKAQHFNADGTGAEWKNGRLGQAHQPELSIQTPLLYYQGQYRSPAWKSELANLAASSAQAC
jgi:flavin reductase (DIM6/NTAB) family NADH-FMN oxidoreductase RutF